MEPFVKNASDENQVRGADGKQKRGREKEINDFKSIMATVGGRRIIYRYIALCGVFESSVGNFGTNSTFYNEGKRSVGLALLMDCNECPNEYFKMIEESKE